ncbi:hypothetical protein ACH4YO_07990 [Streptomyces noursei]|uniref:hypothetical protein n=1 Tax=Streptomyces noursei TaxID=1971 RepID=UPI0033E48E2F
MHRENCIDWLAWRQATSRLMEHEPKVFRSWERQRARAEYFDWLNTFRRAWPDMWAAGTEADTRAQVNDRASELFAEVKEHFEARLREGGRV